MREEMIKALYEAAQSGDPAKVKSVNGDIRLNSALLRAALNGDLLVAIVLIKAGADPEKVLFGAAYFGHAKAVKVLIAAGVDFKAKTEDGETAISIAKRKKHESTVRVLLDAGAVLPPVADEATAPKTYTPAQALHQTSANRIQLPAVTDRPTEKKKRFFGLI